LLHKLEEHLPSIPLSLYHDKRKGELTPSSLYKPPIMRLLSNAQREWKPYRQTMSARLILTKEPFHSAPSTLTGSLARAEPKLQDRLACESIARNMGEAMAREIVITLHFAGRRLPALANYFSKQVLKTILLSASLAFGALAPLAAEATSSCAHASFYGVGDGFHGLRAADGSRFDAHGLTTAHKTLPFGTRLRVTNPANNKSVTVTVTDRGPFIAGRSLDLSYGAFSRIASPGQGVARVCFARV
jgi:rare lipoprotein A